MEQQVKNPALGVLMIQFPLIFSHISSTAIYEKQHMRGVLSPLSLEENYFQMNSQQQHDELNTKHLTPMGVKRKPR